MVRSGRIFAALLSVVAPSLSAQRVDQSAAIALSGAADASARQGARPVSPMRLHQTLGTVALGAFGTALVVGAASGNLGKLMDPVACCPDGGARNQSLRSFDRALVTAGIVSYVGAGALAGYNLMVRNPPSSRPRARHRAHRWLSLAHGAAFVTSAVTGSMMKDAQETDPTKFARLARIHVAANVAFVPLLTAAFSNILFE